MPQVPRRRLPVALAALVAFPLLAWAVAALADEQPPVDVRLRKQPPPPTTGQTYQDTLLIVSKRAGTLSNFTMGGQGWANANPEISQAVQLLPLQELRVPFSVIPTDPSVPMLEINFTLDGWAAHTSLDLSQRAFALSKGPLPARMFPAGQQQVTPPVTGPAMRQPGPPPDDGTLVDRGDMERLGTVDHDRVGQLGPQKSRAIRVHGHFQYRRSDGLILGGDGIAVKIYDEDTGFDEHIITGITDQNGAFDITFTWDPCSVCDSQPDLYVIFECASTKVVIQDTDDDHYRWQTPEYGDFAGTDLDLGNVMPGAEEDMPAVHMANDLVRTWRWLTNRGFDCPQVTGVWPDGSNAFYRADDVEIHCSAAKQWLESTHAHEYGHHFIATFAVRQDPDYCNGFCGDVPPDNCNHCMWCPETDHDAWNEGMPNWLADAVTRSYAPDYGVAPLNFRDQESIQTCPQTGSFENPLSTEGFLGALLRDIEDSTQDDHYPSVPGKDALALGTDEILTVIGLDHPLTPLDFLDKFQARYPFIPCSQIWQTAKNCGYDLDFAAPGVATGLTSPSHSPLISSPDNTIDYAWTPAGDSCAGVQGYSVLVSSAPLLPDTIMDIGGVTAYTTTPLAPGSYWFNLRTVDNAGNWSPSYATIGPLAIRSATSANLAPFWALGWGRVVVPRATADATAGSVSEPVTLAGDGAATYWNAFGLNFGDSGTGTSFHMGLYVDGVFANSAVRGPIASSGTCLVLNGGPVWVDGGRHTFELRMDSDGEVAETNEADNTWGRQWVWATTPLVPGAITSRPTPPDRYGGTASVTDGSLITTNCDGMSFTAQPYWDAVLIDPLDDTEDYDCALYNHSTTASTGFTTQRAVSARGAGMLDAVLVNSNTMGLFTTWDVGVTNYSGGSSSYRAQEVSSNTMALGSPVAVSFAVGELLHLWEIYVPPAKVGPVSITVDLTSPASGPVTVAWLDETFTVGGLLDYEAAAVTNDAGRARLDLTVPSDGYSCLVIYRNPKDLPASKATAPAIDMSVKIDTTPPDFAPLSVVGWYAPLVPRPAADGTPASAPLPTTLEGNAAFTYLNLATTNVSPTAASSMQADVSLDGQLLTSVFYGYYPGFGTSTFNGTLPVSVPGGRHTLSAGLDAPLAVEELEEANNANGQQWIWSPLQLTNGVPVERTEPPDPTGGWTGVTTGDALWFNCDGLRTPAFAPSGGNGYWGAVAVMPGASSDVDVRLHEVASGTMSGFASGLAASLWGAGHGDYVLANFNVTPFRPFDVGVLAYEGSETYMAEVVSSQLLPVGNGTFGPYTLGAYQLLQLYDVWLDPGFYSVRIDNLSGTVDWGMTLHPFDQLYQSKSTCVPEGLAYLNGAGQGESIGVQIVDPGYYGMAVWKVGAADLAKVGGYRLVIHSGATGVEKPLARPQVTALTSVHPNPFNPRTAVAFDLAQPAAASVGVFTLRGALVRRLVDETRAAGHYEVTWDGRDDLGQPVASGVYLVRLQAGDRSDQRKMILVK